MVCAPKGCVRARPFPMSGFRVGLRDRSQRPPRLHPAGPFWPPPGFCHELSFRRSAILSSPASSRDGSAGLPLFPLHAHVATFFFTELSPRSGVSCALLPSVYSTVFFLFFPFRLSRSGGGSPFFAVKTYAALTQPWFPPASIRFVPARPRCFPLQKHPSLSMAASRAR